jgi:heme-degrading monooxygenase HmoA
MILEVAMLTAHVGQERAFEGAMAKAAPVIAGSPGYLGHELRRCVEAPGRYLLLVQWETLEAHTVVFRQSAAFTKWREIIGGFFAAPPVVEHYEQVRTWLRDKTACEKGLDVESVTLIRDHDVRDESESHKQRNGNPGAEAEDRHP